MLTNQQVPRSKLSKYKYFRVPIEELKLSFPQDMRGGSGRQHRRSRVELSSRRRLGDGCARGEGGPLRGHVVHGAALQGWSRVVLPF